MRKPHEADLDRNLFSYVKMGAAEDGAEPRLYLDPRSSPTMFMKASSKANTVNSVATTETLATNNTVIEVPVKVTLTESSARAGVSFHTPAFFCTQSRVSLRYI